MSVYSLRHLSDDAVTRELSESTAADRRSIAAHVARLAEYDRRGLYVQAGYKSMFRYCVGRLRLSEDAACQRIRVARVARAHPAVFEALADGRLNLTTVGLVATHLTEENAGELLASVEGCGIKQVRRLLAERFGPAPPVLSPFVQVAQAPSLALGPTVLDEGNSSVSKRMNLTTPEIPGQASATMAPTASLAPASRAPRGRLTPVGRGCWELVALIGQEARDQLEACRELLGHAVPSGDFAEILERAITLQLEQLRKRRCGATDRPRAAAPKPVRESRSGQTEGRSANPRRIPDAVRRAVWERDGSRCACVSPDGHRCEERERLELDHVVPVARGGLATPENLRLLCRVHNRHVAEREFGRDLVRGRIEAAQRRRAEERLRKAAERERIEARRVAMARQDEELGTALRNLGYRGEQLRRALVHCAERAGAPPEARLKHALGRMAPHARREPCPATAPPSP